MTTAAVGGPMNQFMTYADDIAPGPEEQTVTDANAATMQQGAEAADQAALAERAEQARAERAALTGRTLGYDSGCEGLFADRCGPVTPEELLLWLKGHSQDINDQLRERMLNADMRNELIADLSTLKAQVNQYAPEGLKAQGEALLAAYVGTPYEEAARTALTGIIGNKDDIFGADEATKVSGEMQTVIDKLGKDDQMDMIYIQQLANRLNEQFGFGSAYLSNLHNTTMSIIGNFA